MKRIKSEGAPKQTIYKTVGNIEAGYNLYGPAARDGPRTRVAVRALGEISRSPKATLGGLRYIVAW